MGKVLSSGREWRALGEGLCLDGAEDSTGRPASSQLSPFFSHSIVMLFTIPGKTISFILPLSKPFQINCCQASTSVSSFAPDQNSVAVWPPRKALDLSYMSK